jgi:transposase
MLYLGIDQHRKQLTVNLRNENGDVLLRRQVSTQWCRVRAFLDDLRQMSLPAGGFVAIVEVCGFNDWLLKLLPEYGCQGVLLIQPDKRAKQKTDRRDASQLSEMLWINRTRLLAGQPVRGLRRVHPPTAREAEDRQVTQFRRRLGQLRTQTINRVKYVLRKHNLEQECPTKGLDTIRGRKWAAALSLGTIDRLELDLLLTQWKLWDEQIATLDRQIRQRQAETPTACLLATIPGCGAYTSLALAARIGDIRRYPRASSLANYWGLTPGCRNSGDVTDRLGSITKQGSAMARFLLGQLVLHVLRRDPRMKQWYKGIKARRGAKIARVAVMRRLATIMWHMLKHNEAYCIGGPPSRKHGAAVGAILPAATVESSAAVDFRRDGKGVQGEKKRPPARSPRRRPAALLAHP